MVAIQAFDFRPHSESDDVIRQELRSDRGIRIVSLLSFSLFAMVVGQLGRIPLLSAGAKQAPLLANDVAVAVAVGAGLWLGLRNRAFRLDAVALLALGFAGVGGLSALMSVPRFGLSGFELMFSLAYLLRWVLYMGIYVVVIDALTPREGRQLLKVFEGAVLAFACFGILQSIFLPGFAQIVFPDAALYTQWDPQGRRLVSTFLDPNLAGGLIVVALLLACARATLETWRARNGAGDDRVQKLLAGLCGGVGRLGLFGSPSHVEGYHRGSSGNCGVSPGGSLGVARGRLVQQAFVGRSFAPRAFRGLEPGANRTRRPPHRRCGFQHIRLRSASLRICRSVPECFRPGRGPAIHRRNDRLCWRYAVWYLAVIGATGLRATVE